MDVFRYDFMIRALMAAFLVGLTAPAVGVFLVQRRLALIGDGLGHVAVTGVAFGLVLQRAPLFVALLTAIAGSVAIELIRARGQASGETALAILFYGGIGGGVVLASKAPGGSRSLNQYLFGSISTTTRGDLAVFAVLTVVVLAVVVLLGDALFSVSNDDEFARAGGLPVTALNLMLAALTAVTVVVSMKVVGVLLVSALMVVPVATAQLLARSFRGTLLVSMTVGVVVSVAGVIVSFYANTPSGGSIVLLAIAVFAATLVASRLLVSRRRRTR
jgi:zinc transport system permease protein